MHQRSLIDIRDDKRLCHSERSEESPMNMGIKKKRLNGSRGG